MSRTGKFRRRESSGSRPLPELFQAAGMRLDFSEQTLAPLVAMVQKKLGMEE